jgi:hypothetical protein
MKPDGARGRSTELRSAHCVGVLSPLAIGGKRREEAGLRVILSAFSQDNNLCRSEVNMGADREH